MEPSFEIIPEKTLIGKRLKMNLVEDKTSVLWRSFMPFRNTIKNKTGSELYSIQVYPNSYFNNFSANIEFEKWACLEVKDYSFVPEGMESFTLPGGLYAVFHYKGFSTDTAIFQYIFSTWLPNSNYTLDNRPHFEILGEKYKNNDPDSEEDIWIPVKLKS